MAAGKGGVERSGVSVIVPTTAGAIQVLGLRWSQRVAQSRVVLGNETATTCERWTKDYHSLLTPGDPMRTLLGLPDGGGCRLVVSAEIDLGRSWIVPVSAAHFADARAQSVHADIPRARMLIWGTGAIDFSQPDSADQAKIVENDYHLTSKIDLSREHFAAAAHDGTPVLALLPAGADAERAAGILRKVLGQQPHHIEIVKTLADIIRPIDAFLRKGDFNAPPEMKYAPVPYTPPPPPPPQAQRPAGQPSAASAGSAPAAGASSPPARSGGGLSVGVLGGIAVALIAVIGVGAMMLRSPPATGPAQQATAPRPLAVVPPASPGSVVAPVPPPAPQGTAPVPVPPPVVTTPSSDPAASQGRLTILSPPAGSSCQSEVMAPNARYVETVIDLGADKPVLEIESASLCGLGISGSGTVQARFAPGTVVGSVQSLSSAGRIVFNPGNASGRLPDIAITGGVIDKIELRRK
jgi:diadenosine tetraphosphatase ApaH/serine/threonine PP2A family protein phosphatase